MSVRKDEIHVATLRELAEAHVEIARLTKALDEREADMHMRIRAGYDKTVADAGRAEVEKRDAEIARLTAERDQAVAHRAATNEEIKRLHAVIKAKGFSVEESIALHETRSEVARLAAELAAARAEVDCGQDGPCAKAPGCARHWQERNRELVAELAAARAVTAGVCRYLDCAASDLLAVVTSLYETRARAISDATAARGTVGGLLATAPECPTWCATHDPRDMATAMDGDRRYASPECRDAGRCLTRGPLPKGG